MTGVQTCALPIYRIRSGASISGIIKDNLKGGDLRFISGNVLTGTAINREGYLGYYDNVVSVIPEGKYHEFFGWITPGFSKFSATRTFMSSILPKKEYLMDTNYHGGERAFVLTGVYEKVLPMDIYPMHLLKSILAGNIEMMESLGIYEISEEDFALCEYVCPSKIEIQSIVRNGLDMMIKEMS